MLIKRIITALVLAPAAIAAIFYLPLNYFAFLFILLVSIAAWEWGPLMGFQSKRRRIAFSLANVIILICLWLLLPLESLWLADGSIISTAQYILWIAVAWWCCSAFLTYLYPRCSNFWSNHRSVRGVFGLLTLIPTWFAFIVLRSYDYQANTYHGAQLIMVLFVLVWSADIGAYFFGKAIGKTKLLPNVSPGKTIEGFLGGIFTAAILMLGFGFIMDFTASQLITILAVTFLITTISVLGDLNESMFKRQAGVKDSGSILPGHGGILDRIDSLTATAPIFALCFILFGW